MAPPTPVLIQEDLQRVYNLNQKLSDAKCSLKSITQYECTFNGGLVNCYPFKRLFQDCLMKDGKKQRVEITTMETNAKEKQQINEAKKFLNAESQIRQLYELEQSE
ncbi:hypothetical protein BN7_116 [Wickerhamomyces ciferrii]|uniref:Uncharacterized protein n=1 Tax=Wickerhamomyces ciferrii (strain ATCC 14091 / BCRC 22168 / CBS 111 / JCM 3599 / NBRC 0793 / NRRL Y-1031 F-60-10) TaxID=1206466 RepID=K0KHD3_WICCF|nr:uncharacterized protein BN7_116 [Wickerhamomyces ciferrii]CCH40583.1 hypothetical protein BN7_116 [Wickerhamomyces ciferrii]